MEITVNFVFVLQNQLEQQWQVSLEKGAWKNQSMDKKAHLFRVEATFLKGSQTFQQAFIMLSPPPQKKGGGT